MAKAYDFVFLIAGMGYKWKRVMSLQELDKLLTDDSFKINNPVTIEAIGQAEHLLEIKFKAFKTS